MHELTVAVLCIVMLLKPRNLPAEFLPLYSVNRAGPMTFQQEHLDQAHIETVTFCKFIKRQTLEPIVLSKSNMWFSMNDPDLRERERDWGKMNQYFWSERWRINMGLLTAFIDCLSSMKLFLTYYLEKMSYTMKPKVYSNSYAIYQFSFSILYYRYNPKCTNQVLTKSRKHI